MAMEEVREQFLGPYTSEEDANRTVARMRAIWRRKKWRFEAGRRESDDKWVVYRIFSIKVKTVKPYKSKRSRGPVRMYDRCHQCGNLLSAYGDSKPWREAFCDEECHVVYLERRQFLRKLEKERREYTAWEKTLKGKG